MDLETWVPSCCDKTSWPDRWWDSSDFLVNVCNGNISKVVIATEFGITTDDVEAQQLVQYIVEKDLPGSKRLPKRLLKQNVTSFVDAMEFLEKRYSRTWELLLTITYQLYMLNSGDTRAEVYILQHAKSFDPERIEIEKELIRRAEMEDAVLMAREKQHAALQVERTAAAEKANRVCQSRKERTNLNARAVIAREAELATRTNRKSTDKITRVVANPARGPAFAAKKATAIEQSKLHERDLREREKQRVAQLEKMERIVRIGDAIQHGIDA